MEYVKLKGLVDLKQGMAINSKSNHLVVDHETSLPLLRIADMPTKRKVIFMDESTPERFWADENDIIYTRTGQVGLVFRGQKGVVHNNCFRVIPFDEKVLDRNYLYWVLTLKSIYNYANSIAAGAAQPDLPHDSFKTIQIPFFDIEVQRKIVNILDCFDKAIENNNKRIKILGQMAENLYKEWFVRFRFPGYEKVGFKESRIGKIPSDFRILKMNEVIEYYIGGGWGNDEKNIQYTQDAYVIRGADFPFVKKGDLSTCPYRFHKSSNYKSRELIDGDIVIEVSGGTSEQPVGRAIIISEDLVKRLDKKVICASFCKLVRLDKELIEPYYFLYWMNYLYDTRIIDKFQLQSTGIINFQFEYFLRKGDVLLPPKDIMIEFSDIVKKIHAEIETYAMQNENLIKQRELLLPRLMSGKLEVK